MNRGRWGGILTTIVVSKLMGCSYYIARKKLNQLQQELEVISLNDIGNLIYEHRHQIYQQVEDTVLNRYLFNPVIKL